MDPMLESAPAWAQVNRTSCAQEEIKIIYVSTLCVSFMEIWQQGNEHEARKGPKIGAMYELYGASDCPCAGMCNWR